MKEEKMKKEKTKATKKYWVFRCLMYNKWKWSVCEKSSREKIFLMSITY
jgi:hypothetical protein